MQKWRLFTTWGWDSAIDYLSPKLPSLPFQYYGLWDLVLLRDANQSDGTPLLSSLKYLNSCSVGLLLCRYLWSTEDESYWLWLSGDFFFPKSPAGQMFYSYCEISQDLLDRMAHTLLQIFMVLRRWIIIALVVLICSSIANIGVEILGFAAHVQSFISFDAPLAPRIYIIYIILLFIHCHHLVKIPMCPMLWFIIRYLHLEVLNLFVRKTFREIPNNLALYWILIFKMISPLRR